MTRSLFAILLLLASTRPDAQPIPRWKVGELVEHIKKSDKPIIVTFWATYCIPCIEEIPYFQETIENYKDQEIELLLVSMDFEEMYPGKIRKFAEKQGFNAPIIWLNETNADYFCPIIDPRWSGVMPATLFVNNKTGFRSFYEEKISKERFEQEIKKLAGGQ